MKRESGYYWVRWDNETEFIISYWSESLQGWFLIDNEEKFLDSEFIEIDEKIIKR